MQLSIQVPAKVNFWLEIIKRRRDGYHEIASLMVPVGIYDCVKVQTIAAGIRLDSNSSDIPRDHCNTAWQAAQLYLEKSGWQTGVSIYLQKAIPVAAGLGGGSADAAGVLWLLNRACPTPLSSRDLFQLAARLGADVPFFLLRKPALAAGIGEILEPVDSLVSYPVVLIKPPVVVSTAEAYARIKLTRGRSRIRIASLLADPWEPQQVMENDLESVTLEMVPAIKEIKAWLRQQGALGTLMSGSGPTAFGVFRSLEQARGIAEQARRDWFDCWVKATHVLAG